MTNPTGRANRAREIFSEAIEHHAPSEWPGFLQSACGTDGALRQKVQKLLDAHEQLSAFMASPAAGHSETELLQHHEEIGHWIDRYRLLEQLGEGGMGRVFVAEQSEPVRRRVALKIIKPGMDTRHVVARFEAERQALAVMDHPNIAKVLDGGSTKLGRPYFVMELVRGMPITAYCDKARLTPRQRLELFVMVCEAVQHAHQKGIIHRDLKPSNILITVNDGRPLPKVIDFGIAKALGQQLTDSTLYTNFMQMLGTPLYMSPEQAELSSQDIDTRSDVYSLGVLLYELLTGATPFDNEDFKKVGFDEMRRMIREVEPPTPSRRISTLDDEAASTLSEKRSIDQRQFNRMLRGELDWIVMKALDKDRNRRYSSPEALARDIENHLQNRAVEACPPSALYRCKKYVRRNKGVLTAGILVGCALIAGTAVSAWQATEAIEAKKQAEKAVFAEKKARKSESESLKKVTIAEKNARRELSKFQTIYNFLMSDLLIQAKPESSEFNFENDVTLLAVVDLAADKIAERYQKEPELEYEVRVLLAQIYDGLGSLAKAEQQWQTAETIAFQQFGEDDFRPWFASSQHGVTLTNLGKYREGFALCERGYEGLRRTLPLNDPLTVEVLEDLGIARVLAGKADEGIANCKEALRLFNEILPKKVPDRSALVTALDVAHLEKQAIPIAEEDVRIKMEAFGAEHLDTVESMTNLAWVYVRDCQFEKARPLAEQAISTLANKLGSVNPRTLRANCLLAKIEHGQGRNREALALAQSCVEKSTELLGAKHPHTLQAMEELAEIHADQGRFDLALPLHETVLQLRIERQGPENWKTLQVAGFIAWEHLHLNHPEKALALAEENLRATKAAPLTPKQFEGQRLFCMDVIGGAYLKLGRVDEAIPLFREGSEVRASLWGANDRETIKSYDNLAWAHLQRGDYEEGISVYEDALQRSREVNGPQHLTTMSIMCRLVIALQDHGDFDKSIPLLNELVPFTEKEYGADALDSHVAWLAKLGLALLKVSNYTEAESVLRRCLAIREAKQPDNWTTYNTQSLLGGALLSQNKLAEAEPLLLAGYEGMKAREEAIPPYGKTYLVNAVERLVQLYTALNKPEEAEKWRALLPAPDAGKATESQ